MLYNNIYAWHCNGLIYLLSTWKQLFQSIRPILVLHAFSFSKAVSNAANLVRNNFVSTIRDEIEKVDLDELQAVLYDVY